MFCDTIPRFDRTETMALDPGLIPSGLKDLGDVTPEPPNPQRGSKQLMHRTSFPLAASPRFPHPSSAGLVVDHAVDADADSQSATITQSFYLLLGWFELDHYDEVITHTISSSRCGRCVWYGSTQRSSHGV